MYYRLKNPEIFFKDVRPGRRIHWFSCPGNLLSIEPFCHLNATDIGLLFQIVLCATNQAKGAQEPRWLLASTLLRACKLPKGSSLAPRMSRLVELGILEVSETIGESLTDNFINAPSPPLTVLYYTNNTKQTVDGLDLSGVNSHTPSGGNPRYIRFAEVYPKKVGPNIGGALLAKVPEEQLESFFLAVKNYSNKVRREKTPEKYIISPSNFISDRWPEFVEVNEAASPKDEMKERYSKLAEKLESTK